MSGPIQTFPALRPLPAMVIPVFQEALRSVHREGQVEFRRAYCSVPREWVGRQVWMRHAPRMVRVYSL